MVVPRLRPFRIETATDPVTGRRGPVLPDGLTSWDLPSKRYRRLLRGVYVSTVVPVTPLLLAEAGLLLAGTGAVASHHTAARVWGGSSRTTGSSTSRARHARGCGA